MAPAVLHRVIHGTTAPEPWQKALLTIRPAILHNHRRHRVLHADYPAVIPETDVAEGESAPTVLGTLVTGLTDGDIYRLDIFEGDEYERKTVEVEIVADVDNVDQAASKSDSSPPTSFISSKQTAKAQTYIWIAGTHRLDRREWDFEEFRREKMGGWVGSSAEGGQEREDIREVDEAVKRGEVPGVDPTGGRGFGGKIQDELKRIGTPSGSSGSQTPA